MLDTNTLIYIVNKRPASVAAQMNALGDADTLCMSFVSYAEMLRGAHGSQHPAQSTQNLLDLTQTVPVLFPTGAVGQSMCDHYAVQGAALKRAGRPIGGNDLWIASHALAEQATLVTHNQSEFGRIEGLLIEDWAA
jgi:tRNA(fMet)-specific endonuclease VapC